MSEENKNEQNIAEIRGVRDQLEKLTATLNSQICALNAKKEEKTQNEKRDQTKFNTLAELFQRISGFSMVDDINNPKVLTQDHIILLALNKDQAFDQMKLKEEDFQKSIFHIESLVKILKLMDDTAVKIYMNKDMPILLVSKTFAAWLAPRIEDEQ